MWLKGRANMVFFNYGAHTFLVPSMFFQCFHEHSGDLYKNWEYWFGLDRSEMLLCTIGMNKI